MQEQIFKNGVLIDEITHPDRVPEIVAGWRTRAVAKLHGLWDDIMTALEALPEPQRTISLGVWLEGAEHHRDSRTIQEIGPALGLTEEQIDALFWEAAALEV